MQIRIVIVSIALLLSACAAPVRYDYVKEGVSEDMKTKALSDCQYQIRLRTTPAAEQAESRKLCMQGQGFHLARVK